MVSRLHGKMPVVVKMSAAAPRAVATAKGGAGLVEAFARRTGLWAAAAALLPARRDPRQGFTTDAWLCALVHGLLAGGRGFCATEPLRGDAPLLAAIGLRRAPSAETVEEVAKYLALPAVGGHAALSEVLARHAKNLLRRETLPSLMHEGFVPVWGDGTLLETEGKTKDALVRIDGRWGQVAAAVFVGPYAAACDFSRVVDAQKSEGELNATRRLLPGACALLEDTRLLPKALFLMDSLYGEDGTLTLLERADGARHIVGANGLARAEQVLREQPATQWRDTTSRTASRGWEQSAVCRAWIQCEGWERKRALVGRRYRLKDELFDRYAAVITNLDEHDPRIAAIMRRDGLCFAEAVWHLYDHKQAMENQWKDLLCDLGLHTMPCGKAAVNAVFLDAALALNLKTGTVRLCLGRPAMRLWRFRRDIIDVAATVARHAGRAVVQFLDARADRLRELDVGFGRLARL